MKTRKEYRAAAYEDLKGKWSPIVVATLVWTIISVATSLLNEGSQFKLPLGTIACMTIAYWALWICVQMPLSLGYEIASLNFKRDKNPDGFMSNMFCMFRDGNYGRGIAVPLLSAIYTFLWTLLLIVPGIIKSLAYALTPYVAKDHPELSADDCIHESQEMMRGHKWELFLLLLSFIGWILLSILTLGIGMLWVVPYVQVSMAHFYEDVKAEYENHPMAEGEAATTEQ